MHKKKNSLEFIYANLPIPKEVGIIISKGIADNYSEDEISDFILNSKKIKKDEQFLNFKLKLLKAETFKTVWLIQWVKKDKKYKVIILGSEI